MPNRLGMLMMAGEKQKGTIMYEIAIVSAHAPSAGGGKYRRPVHIRVFDPDVQKTEYARKGKGKAVKAHTVWKNVDSRYHGPKSAYGQCMAAARALIAMLNERGQS